MEFMCAWRFDIASFHVELQDINYVLQIADCDQRKGKKLCVIKSEGNLNVQICWKNLYIESCQQDV